MSVAPHPLQHTPRVNWAAMAFAWSVLVTVGGWVFITGAMNTRLQVVEARTEPLARGDLRAVQQDVAWIREHLQRAREP